MSSHWVQRACMELIVERNKWDWWWRKGRACDWMTDEDGAMVSSLAFGLWWMAKPGVTWDCLSLPPLTPFCKFALSRSLNLSHTRTRTHTHTHTQTHTHYPSLFSSPFVFQLVCTAIYGKAKNLILHQIRENILILSNSSLLKIYECVSIQSMNPILVCQNKF